MKKIYFLVLLSLAFAMLSASAQPFVAEYFHEKIIVVGFDAKVIDNPAGRIDYSTESGVVQIGVSTFDQLAQQYEFVELEQMFQQIKYKEWNEDGIYLQNIYRVTLAENAQIESAVKALAADSNILFAEYETINRRRYTPNDPSFSTQWHHPVIFTPETWDYTTGSDEIIVGIVDSGVYFTHEDLQDNIWINEAELPGFDIDQILETGVISGGDNVDNDGNGYVDDVVGYNFYGAGSNQSYQYYETNDHGTHVAGCAGAVGDNEIGLTGASMNVKILGTRHAPTFMDYPYVQNGYDGITYCVDTGAKIINCSWGGPGSGTMPNSVVNYATSNGALVVTAAGNSNTEHTNYYQDYPADATNALCVAATDQYDNKAGFSDFGEPIDISAPGVGIQSTIIGGSGYEAFNGTSMASPVVAGVAALVLSMNPDLEPLELRTRLMDTADNIDANNEDYIGLLGAGRVNAFRATLYDHIPNLTIQSVSFTESDESSDGDGNPNPGEIALIELEIANASFEGGTWADAENIDFTITCENPQVSILDGTENFTIAQISGGESISTSANPIKIQIPEESDIQQLELTLQVAANQTAETPYYAAHPFIVTFSLNQAGWPYDLGSGTKSSPVITNFGGAKKAIFGDSSGNVHVMNADGTSAEGFPVNIGGSITSALAVGDLDNDGSNEIVAAVESGSLVAIDSAGEIIFEYALAGMIKSNPIIADVNGNGNKEIIAVNLIGEQMVVLNADGTDYGNFPISLSDGGTLASPAVGDLDGNGSLEVLAVSITGTLYAIDTSTASSLANWPVDIGSSSGGGPIVANINDDSDPEVIAVTSAGNLFAFTHDGVEIFSRAVGCQVKGSPVISDLNNDNSANIIVGANNGTLVIMDNNGEDLAGFPMNMGSPIDSTPVLADLDNDEAMDIIFGTANGYLHAINFNGNEARNFPYHTGSSVDTSAALGDLDGDGDLDIIVPNSSEIVVIDFKEAVANVEWSCLKKNPQRTGNYVEFTSDAQPNETPQLVNRLDNNYPNPFNPTTNISFSLQQAGDVKLHIYNAKGQVVKTLVNDHLSQGMHRVVWDGTDKHQNSAASGIYFYRLETNEFDSMKKMVLIK